MNNAVASKNKPTLLTWFLISLAILIVFSYCRIGYGDALPFAIYSGQPFSLDTFFIISGHLLAFGMYPLSLLRNRDHSRKAFRTVLFSGSIVLLFQSAVRLVSAQIGHIDCGNNCVSGTYTDDLVINGMTIGILLIAFGVIAWFWRYQQPSLQTKEKT
jgi:hypothetical protein